jgi:hypothetical protein
VEQQQPPHLQSSSGRSSRTAAAPAAAAALPAQLQEGKKIIGEIQKWRPRLCIAAAPRVSPQPAASVLQVPQEDGEGGECKGTA